MTYTVGPIVDEYDVANGQTSFFDEKPNPYALKI